MISGSDYILKSICDADENIQKIVDVKLDFYNDCFSTNENIIQESTTIYQDEIIKLTKSKQYKI